MTSEKIFEYFDANGDGSLSAEEFKTGLYNLDKIRFKLSDNQVGQLVVLFDKDGDGNVDMEGASPRPLSLLFVCRGTTAHAPRRPQNSRLTAST